MATYTKYNVQANEYEMYRKIRSLNIVNTPTLLDYDPKQKILTMEKIPELNISDMYGDKLSDVPPYIIDEVRNIIKTLRDNGIEYPDITGYNFIEYQNKIWIIDFEHARIKSKNFDPFVIHFINGADSWNPNFA